MDYFDVTNDEDTALVATSTADSVTSIAADSWKSITATADGDIALSGDGDIITGALNSATGNISVSSENGNLNITDAINQDQDVVGIDGPLGGVSLIADNGWVYTTGDPLDPIAHPPVLDVDITGSSDDTTGVETGVDLPAGSGKAAIVIISKNHDLTVGENATLTANGTYYWQDVTYDDRSSVNFKMDGHPIDVAIYLGSYDYDSITDTETGGNVTVNCYVDMADNDNGTMVVDALDTVDIGDNFEDSWSNGQENGLELVSRISGSIDEVLLIEPPRLPYALEARGNILPSFMDAGLDTYVLRGREVLAEVLASVGAAPVVAPVGVDLEDRREMKEEDTDALMQELGKETGDANAPMYLAQAYKQPPLNTLNTDLRPSGKKIKTFLDQAKTLKDVEGTRIAALRRVVGEVPSDQPPDEILSTVIEKLKGHKDDGTYYDLAGQWLGALKENVGFQVTELGRSGEESIGSAMRRYGFFEGDTRTAIFVQMYLDRSFGG
jgi:hypothetical protein